MTTKPDLKAATASPHEAATNTPGKAGSPLRQPEYTLNATHVQALKESAISDDVIRDRGYKTITDPNELADLGFALAQRRVPGLLLPLHGTDGKQPFSVYRPDSPRVHEDRKAKKNPDGTYPTKAIKYETPKGAPIRLDCPPRCLPKMGDPSVPLWVTEGQKKADALASVSLCSIALLGVWTFNTKHKDNSGHTVFYTDWSYIELTGRLVRIVFDSDLMTKPQVRQALDRLIEYLQRKGATVDAVYLPNDPQKGKVGVDDWLATGHTVTELENLITAPRPAPQPAPAIVELLDKAPPMMTRPLTLHEGRAYAAIWPYT